MKIQLNDSLRSRFFAQYINTCYCGDHGENFIEEWKESTFISFIEAEQEQAFLFLRSIEAITDEEAIEVAKIINGDSDYWYAPANGRNAIAELEWTWPSPKTMGELNDYLRSIGVALPYLGHSVADLEAAGWIKLIEHKTSN
ncbi:hypothetical protein LZD49_07255 [Dyadobacter sp. CY261]|uniref:hypothetical protein n=1 Tax=Dyadobacter sp. CY261 TaxID=2907203 RepID=UPI001F1BFB11|nr:hypothetical protein [Dyadobacter sp. CY261]MCF0070263.1 hypothetical protein [Dyadobacter sp. CY261]